MKQIKRSISFLLEQRKNRKTGEVRVKNVPILINIAWQGKRIKTTTGQRIDFKKWDADKEKVKARAKNKAGRTATEINTVLSNLYTKVNDLFYLCEAKGTTPTKQDINIALDKIPAKEKKLLPDEITVNDAYNLFTEQRGKANNWTISTYKKHRTIHRHLVAYNPSKKLKDIDTDMINSFIDYLHEKGLRNTTIKKDLKFVREFLNWCYLNDYYKDTKTIKYRPKLKGTSGANRTIIFLTWRELQQLYHYPFKTVKHKQVRDVFCFQCFTGLRYSDTYNLKKTDVQPDKIVVTTQKTGDRLEIELNKYAREILDKYDAIPFKGGKALPVISNQKMNDYLKEICRIAGIIEPVTKVHYSGSKRIEETYPKYALIGTHAGRRTFVTNCLTMGIPAEVVMKWTGHKKFEVMRPYMEIVNDLKKQEMQRWDDFSMTDILEDK